MANVKSAEKRNRQNKKKNAVNKMNKATMKTSVRELKSTASSDKKEGLSAKLRAAQKIIAQSAKKGVIHKRTAARYISRLAALVNKSASK